MSCVRTRNHDSRVVEVSIERTRACKLSMNWLAYSEVPLTRIQSSKFNKYPVLNRKNNTITNEFTTFPILPLEI